MIDVPGLTMMHDFAVTESHFGWLDLPVVFDLNLVEHGDALPVGRLLRRPHRRHGARRQQDPVVRHLDCPLGS